MQKSLKQVNATEEYLTLTPPHSTGAEVERSTGKHNAHFHGLQMIDLNAVRTFTQHLKGRKAYNCVFTLESNRKISCKCSFIFQRGNSLKRIGTTWSFLSQKASIVDSFLVFCLYCLYIFDFVWDVLLLTHLHLL